jgi:hypothetical protein
MAMHGHFTIHLQGEIVELTVMTAKKIGMRFVAKEQQENLIETI